LSSTNIFGAEVFHINFSNGLDCLYVVIQIGY